MQQIHDSGFRVFIPFRPGFYDAPVWPSRTTPEEALAIWESVRESISRTLEPDDKQSLVVLHNYASALSGMSRFDEAEPLLREVIERRSRVYGTDHPQTLGTFTCTSDLFCQLRDPDNPAPLVAATTSERSGSIVFERYTPPADTIVSSVCW